FSFRARRNDDRMLINETPPSVRRIKTDRDDAFALEITGEIESADIENMFGLLEGACGLHELIDVLVVVHDYKGFDWNALWREQTYQIKSNALMHIRKCALVGASGWMTAGISLAKPFTSIKIKQFDLDELEQAWAWVGASPLPQ